MSCAGIIDGSGSWHDRGTLQPQRSSANSSCADRASALKILKAAGRTIGGTGNAIRWFPLNERHSSPTALANAIKATSYAFIPSHCAAEPSVDASAFAARLEGDRQLLLVGDSLAAQHYLSLACLLDSEVLARPRASAQAEERANLTSSHARSARVPAAETTAGTSTTAAATAPAAAPATSDESTAAHAAATKLVSPAPLTAPRPPAQIGGELLLRGGGRIELVSSDFLSSASSLLSACARRGLQLKAGSCRASANASAPHASGATRPNASAARHADAARPAAHAQARWSPPHWLDETIRLISADEMSSTGPRLVDARRQDQSWTARLRSGAASAGDALVLSSGPHWVGRLEALGAPHVRASYEQMVESSLSHLASVDYRGAAFYRTNYAPGCGKALDNARSSVLGHDAPHGWGLLHSFDAVWPRVAARVYPKLRVLNVSGPSSQRPDVHVGPLSAAGEDCLHFVMPGGPVDVWSVLLQDGLTP